MLHVNELPGKTPGAQTNKLIKVNGNELLFAYIPVYNI